MEQIEKLLGSLSDLVWGPPLLVLLCGTHLFLTIRLRFIQRYTGTAIRLSLQTSSEGTGDVSQFGALTTALAATIGTGNIVGVATGGRGRLARAPSYGCGSPASSGSRRSTPRRSSP
jgi:AGCS family alanine or glycine:cation symporter